MRDKYKNIIGEDYLVHETIYNKIAYDISLLIMHKNGYGFCRTYWVENFDNTIFLDWLSVEPNKRNLKIGSKLIDSHLEFAEQINYNSMLQVEIGTWMYDWY